MGLWSDLTDEEFDLKFPIFQKNSVNNSSVPDSKERVVNSHLPHKVNWVEEGYVTEARDHYHNCNSQSYAKAAADMVEALHKKRTGWLIKLSAKQFIDC